jgi:hypothetical protein
MPASVSSAISARVVWWNLRRYILRSPISFDRSSSRCVIDQWLGTELPLHHLLKQQGFACTQALLARHSGAIESAPIAGAAGWANQGQVE